MILSTVRHVVRITYPFFCKARNAPTQPKIWFRSIRARCINNLRCLFRRLTPSNYRSQVLSSVPKGVIRLSLNIYELRPYFSSSQVGIRSLYSGKKVVNILALFFLHSVDLSLMKQMILFVFRTRVNKRCIFILWRCGFVNTGLAICFPSYVALKKGKVQRILQGSISPTFDARLFVRKFHAKLLCA